MRTTYAGLAPFGIIVAALTFLAAGAHSAAAAHSARVRAAIDKLYASSPDTVGAPTPDRLLWLQDGQPRPQVSDLLAALRGAPAEGLHPEDYGLDLLVGAWDRVGPDPASLEDLVALDRATTRAFLSYLADRRFGRVDLRSLGIGFELPRADYDLAFVVRDALARDRVAETVAEAAPASAQYQALKAALPRYRELAANPALTVLMPVGKLVPGDEYAGVDRLAVRLAALGDLPAEHLPWSDPAAEEVMSRLRPPAGIWSGDGIRRATYSGPIVEAVRRFQDRHGLDADGIIGSRTWMALNVPIAQRVRQIELGLERLRWLPEMREGPFILVNTPAFHLYGYESPAQTTSPSLAMKVVVGRATEADTPVFSDEMSYIVFRPYWNPPRSIIRDEFMPEIDTDPQYLEKHELEIVGVTRENASTVVPATAENIELLRSGQLAVRQRPGPKNSLGLVKFIFPNSHAIYLHDTPSRSLFVRQRRDFSHGCIRVEDPVALARFVLRDQPEWTTESIQAAMNAEERRTVTLRRPVPVYIVYLTAMARSDGTVLFYDDIYGRDAELEQALRR